MGYFGRLRSLSKGRSTSVEPALRPADRAPGSAPEPLEREVTRPAPPAAPPPPARHRVAARDVPEPAPPERPAAGGGEPPPAVRTAEPAAEPAAVEAPWRRANRIDPRPGQEPGPLAATSAEPVERERLVEARPAAAQRGGREEQERSEGRPSRPPAARRRPPDAPRPAEPQAGGRPAAGPEERFREALVRVRSWMAEPGPEGGEAEPAAPPAMKTVTVPAAPSPPPPVRPEAPPGQSSGPLAVREGVRRERPAPPVAAPGPGEERVELSIGTIYVTVEESASGTPGARTGRARDGGAAPAAGAGVGAVPRNYLRGW